MGEFHVSNRDESVRMFRNDLLERTTYVHPLVPHLIYIPIVIALLWIRRLVKKSHMRHHFVDPGEDYGVSSPLSDIVFGTSGGKKSTESSRAT